MCMSQRDSARTFGKGDPLDALAVARAALREEELPTAQLAGPEREIALILDHRTNLVVECTRLQSRMRWLLYELDPTIELNRRSLDNFRILDALQQHLNGLATSTLQRITIELLERIRELRHGELVVIARAVRDGDLLAVRAVTLAQGIDVRFGLGLPSAGFAGVERAYREAILCLARATRMRPVVLLRDLPALETAMAGTDTTARAVIAATGTGLRTLDPTDRMMAIDTVRAFAAADLSQRRTRGHRTPRPPEHRSSPPRPDPRQHGPQPVNLPRPRRSALRGRDPPRRRRSGA
jgi:hypothetical protein